MSYAVRDVTDFASLALAQGLARLPRRRFPLLAYVEFVRVIDFSSYCTRRDVRHLLAYFALCPEVEGICILAVAPTLATGTVVQWHSLNDLSPSSLRTENLGGCEVKTFWKILQEYRSQ